MTILHFSSLFKQPLDRLLWGLVALLYMVDAVLIVQQGVTIGAEPVEYFIKWGAACIVIALIGHFLIKDDSVTGFGVGMLQMHLAIVPLAWLTYLCARFNLPLRDDWFIAADHMLGFDWRSFLNWMNDRPNLADTLSFCYRTFMFQPVIWLCLLYAFKHVERAKCFLASFIISCMATSVLSGLLPAVGGYVYYNLLPADYPNIMPSVPRVHEETLLGLRAHTYNTLPWLMNVKGIVTFPSFHATAGVLFIYASFVFRNARLLMIALNFGMIASTPIDGGHYLVDAIAGVLIGIVSIAIAVRVSTRQQV